MIPRRGSLILLALILVLSGLSAVPAQQDDTEYFPEHGHFVTGEFLAFYRSVPNAELLFGNPITEAFEDPLRSGGIQVQYFEKVRLDYDPRKAEGRRVTIADLGSFLYSETQRGLPPGFSTNTPMCRVFQPSGHNVCYGFLQFYDRHNGKVLFGQPISETELIDDRLVQYFEKVRMEWRVDQPVGQRVALTEIGRIDFSRRIGDPKRLEPVAAPEFRLMQLRVHAFVERPLAASGQQQRLYIIVRNQFNEPLADIPVVVTITYPNGKVVNTRLVNLTDEDGLARYEFTVDPARPNQVVQVLVSADAPNGPSAETRTWFRTWW